LGWLFDPYLDAASIRHHALESHCQHTLGTLRQIVVVRFLGTLRMRHVAGSNCKGQQEKEGQAKIGDQKPKIETRKPRGIIRFLVFEFRAWGFQIRPRGSGRRSSEIETGKSKFVNPEHLFGVLNSNFRAWGVQLRVSSFDYRVSNFQ